MALVDGARVDSFSLETSTARLPLATSTKYSAPRSPLSSRWTKATFVPSGLHLIDSGARPRMPASLNIDSMVSSFAPCASCAGAVVPVWANANSGEKKQRRNAAKRAFKLAPEWELDDEKVYIRSQADGEARSLAMGPQRP